MTKQKYELPKGFIMKNKEFQTPNGQKNFEISVKNFTEKSIRDKLPYTIGKTYDEVYSYIYNSFSQKFDYENGTIDY